MHTIKTGLFAFAVAAVAVATPALAADQPAADQPTGQQFVDIFNKIYGDHSAEGYRANHAKGILVEGTFTPTKKAAGLSKAAQFQAAVPVTVRFSDAGGVPNVSDSDPNGFPKGMAVKFKLPDGTDTDIVCISANGFPASTPAEFYAFLTAISKSGPDAPHPTPVEDWVKSHPATQHFLAQFAMAPASFVTESYYGNDAFKFTSAKGESQYIRYFLRPVAKEKLIDPKDAAKLPADYLESDLTARLKKGPVSFRLVAQLAKDGDPTSDATKLWPDSNPKVVLGTIKLTKLSADQEKTQRQILFTPINLTDGIEASDDPLIEARGDAYAVSYGKRAQ